MIAFRIACAAVALCAVADAAAAQQGQGTPLNPSQLAAEAQAQAVIQNFRFDPSTYIDQPPPWSASDWRNGNNQPLCVEGQVKDAAAPKVVKAMPAPGSVVRPGAMVLSITFDQPMACKANTADGSPFPVPCPGDKAAVVVAPDQRTLTTVCQVEAGASYSMPIDGFVSAKGAKSQRYDLEFTTSTAEPVSSARQALAQEKAGSVRR